MANNYHWELNEGALEVMPTKDGLTNVIVAINYQRVGTDQNQRSFTYAGQMVCPSPSSDDFTLYDNITKQQIISWLESNINTSEIDGIIDEELSKQSTIVLPLPF